MKKGLINSIFTHLPDILFIVINSLFVAKYSIRYDIFPFGTVLIYATFSLVFLMFRDKINFRSGLYSKQIYILISCLLLLTVFVIQRLINPYNIQVDRWSAIHNFIFTLFQGKYPYAAQTHLGGYGSPFPLWQVFHIPFYWLGDVAAAFLFVLAILMFALPKVLLSYAKSSYYIILLIISPAFWYEVAVRSDLMYNFILCFIICSLLEKYKYFVAKHPVSVALICGLMLSTRFSIIIPFALTLGSDFLSANIKNKASYILITLFVFVLSFVPFVFWDWKSLLFFQYNPFILQTRQGSVFEIGLLLLMILWYTLRIKKNMENIGFYTTIIISIFVSTTFIHRMIDANFADSLFSSSFDITYFNMALPFAIFYISNKIKET